MNPRTFLKEFEQAADHERLVDLMYDEMAAYCRENNVTTDDVSNEALEQLAEGFVKRGFGVPESDETAMARTEWDTQ